MNTIQNQSEFALVADQRQPSNSHILLALTPQRSRMSDLKDQLQTIDGVGEVTAEKIMEIVEGDSELPEAITKAHKHAKDGNARMAASYLGEVLE